MSITTAPRRSVQSPTPERFLPLARLSVETYEAMIASGAFGKNDRLELIEGTLVVEVSHTTVRADRVLAATTFKSGWRSTDP